MRGIEVLLIASSAFFSILVVAFLSIVMIRLIRNKSLSKAEHQVKRNPDLSRRVIESGSSVNQDLVESLTRMGDKKKIETYLDGSASVHGIDISQLGAYYDAAGVTQRYMDILLHSTSWKKRAFAAEKLGRIGSGQSVPTLLSVVRNVKDEDDDVRGAALRAIGRIRDESAIPFLIRALGSPETWLPPRIGEILVNIGQAAIPPLIKELKNIESENRRIWAAEILGWLEARAAVLPLIESLSDISPEVRAKAAGSLGKLKDDRALGRLLELLVSEPAPFVRVRIAQTLGAIGNPSVVDHLINILKDPEWWVRVRTVEALEYLGDQAVPALLVALEDEDPEVQRRASMALERIGYIEKVLDEYGQEKFRPDIRKILFRAAKSGVIESIREKMSSADLQLQKNIVRILGEAGVKESADLLLEALKKASDWTLKARIVQSLGKVGAKNALPELVECLKDGKYWVRKSAADAIALLEGKEAGDRIAYMLNDPNPYARQAALNALLKLNLSGYRNRMEILLEDPSHEVKSTAIHVMADMGFPISHELCRRFLTESSEEVRIEIIRYFSKAKDFSLTPEIMRLLPISSQLLRNEIIHLVTQMDSPQFSTLVDPLDRKSLSKEALCSLIDIASIVGDESAVRFVMEFTDHLDSMLRTSALRALKKMKPKGHVAIFEKALSDPSDEVRVTALAAISLNFDVKTLSKARHMLEDPSTDIRLALALAYGASGASAFKEKLSTLFSSDPSPAVRAGALVSLACVNGSLTVATLSKEAIEEKREELRKIVKDDRFGDMIRVIREKARASRRIEVEMLLAEDERNFTEEMIENLKGSLDPDLRARIMDMLKITANEEVFISIFSILKKDPSKWVRIKAMETLVQMERDKEVISALAFALTDPSPEVRIAAAGLLGSYLRPEALEVLLNALDTTDREFREAITTSLSRILSRQPEQIQDLIQQIPASKTRKLGMSWLLGKTRQPGAIRFLTELLKDPDPDVRASAIGAMAKFKDQPLAEYLKQMIYDPNERVRAAAVNALSMAGDTKAFEIVKSALEDIDGFVRKRAAVGLARIDLEKALVEMEKRKTRFEEIESCLRGVVWAAGKMFDPVFGEDPVARSVVIELCPEEDLLKELKSSPKEERRLHAFRILAAAHRYNPRNLNAIVKNDPSGAIREEAKALLAGQ